MSGVVTAAVLEMHHLPVAESDFIIPALKLLCFSQRDECTLRMGRGSDACLHSSAGLGSEGLTPPVGEQYGSSMACE